MWEIHCRHVNGSTKWLELAATGIKEMIVFSSFNQCQYTVHCSPLQVRVHQDSFLGGSVGYSVHVVHQPLGGEL